MADLRRIKIRGMWTPNYIIWLKGFVHGKRKIVSFDGEDNKKIRSPYLYERRYLFIEYREKLLRELEEQLLPLKREISDAQVKIYVNQEKLTVIKKKLTCLEVPVTGNEFRVKIKLEVLEEQLEFAIAEEKSCIEKLEENEKELNLLAKHLLEANVSREFAKAYVYIAGVQRSLNNSNCYLKADDYTKEVYQDLIPVSG